VALRPASLWDRARNVGTVSTGLPTANDRPIALETALQRLNVAVALRLSTDVVGTAQRYGCALHEQRGNALCTILLIRRRDLDCQLLQRLHDSGFREEVIDYAVESLREATASA
jgi:hypothetical protein